jgi:uncharacterized protein YkwD
MKYRFTRYYWTMALAFLPLAGCSGVSSWPLPVVVEDTVALSGDAALDPIVLISESGSEAATPCLGSDLPGTADHQAMLDALNAYRAENGLAPLQYSHVLEQTIVDHCHDLYERDYFAHITPEGLRPADRAMSNGFCHRYVGENLAAGQPTLDRVMIAWKESPDHNINMLEPRYVYVGMAKYTAPTGRIFWGQLFAFHVDE